VDERLAANRAMWDERVPLHVGSKFYDVDGFRNGRDTLEPFEVEEVGDVNGKSLLHLQCHFGLDTLSWARRGATVTGLDFSPQAVEAARVLAHQIGLQDKADFVCSNVYDAPAAVNKRTYEIVYTGHGALNWLPDIERWADVVVACLNPGPGSFLYLAEFHPLHEIFGWTDLTIEADYFHDAAGTRDDTPGSYADMSAVTTNNESHEWRHPLGDIISALTTRGLHLEFLHERPFTLWQRWPLLEEHDDGTYQFPAGMPRIPLSYSLRASTTSG